jgi:cell division septation protein DedD
LGAKVPQINGSVYIKILKLKEPQFNKLFNIEKLKKAEMVKAGNHHHHHEMHSVPSKHIAPPTIHRRDSSSNPHLQPEQPAKTNGTPKPTPPQSKPTAVPTAKPKEPAKMPAPQPVKQPSSASKGESFISFDSSPNKPA